MHAKQHKKVEQEEGACEVGLWYISFADMITLLLSFFVMLTSFSSFDKKAIKNIRDTSMKMYPSIVTNVSQGSNSIVDQGYTCPVQTHGTENTTDPTWGVKPPAAPPTTANDFNQQKIVTIPLSSMFLGSSCAAAPTAAGCMNLLAKYVAASPYRVRLAIGGADKNMVLARQCKVAAMLGERGVNTRHIALAPPGCGDCDEQQLVLTLLPEGAFK